MESQRQIRYGELIRSIISDCLIKEDFYNEDINLTSVTVSFVRMSKDLKIANVYFMPLGGKNKLDVLNSLKKVSGRIKKIISDNISLRQTPKLYFKIDETFEYAQNIQKILEKIKK